MVTFIILKIPTKFGHDTGIMIIETVVYWDLRVSISSQLESCKAIEEHSLFTLYMSFRMNKYDDGLITGNHNFHLNGSILCLTSEWHIRKIRLNSACTCNIQTKSMNLILFQKNMHKFLCSILPMNKNIKSRTKAFTLMSNSKGTCKR